MSFLRTTKVKHLNAAFLLALLGFINIGKAFHKHKQYNDSHKEIIANIVVQQTVNDCAICNFQIAKDCDLHFINTDIVKPEYSLNSDFNFFVSFFISFSITKSVRGPPSVIA